MKYNFIILGSSWDFYKQAYRDVLDLPNVSYRSSITDNPILRKLIYLHHCEKINSIINIPYKQIWNHLLIKNSFDNNNNLCYIVFYDWYCKNIKVLESIRNSYPQAKIVVVFNDLIRAKRISYTNAPIDVKFLKSHCDLIISFDFEESRRFMLKYHSVPYSKPDEKYSYHSSYKHPEFDIYFLGQAKNRLQEIMAIYYALKKMNLKLNFILANVPLENQIETTDIRYIDGIGISYKENIQHISNAKCLLEIMQKDGTGYTSRTLEAIAFGKKLLTNNPYIVKAPFYNKDYISIFQSTDDIDINFLEQIASNTCIIDYKYIDNLSPIKFLEFIEDNL